MWQRVAAVLMTIAGLMMAVLGVVSEDDSTIRSLGVAILVGGVIWLYSQRKPKQRPDTETVPPLRWYQSPILWVPIIGIVIFIISLSL